MSSAPSHPPVPHRRPRRLYRPHLRLMHPSPAPPPLGPADVTHSHAPHHAAPHVTLVDAVAVFATLYVAILMIRFLGW